MKHLFLFILLILGGNAGFAQTDNPQSIRTYPMKYPHLRAYISALRLGLACLIGTLLLPSCRQEDPLPAVLVEADSLIARGEAGRAVFLLSDHQGERRGWSSSLQMRYDLLRLKAEDRDYYVHRTDKAVWPMLLYYEEHPEECRMDEVYFYAARVYHDMGDAPQACELYEKALAVTSDDVLRRDTYRRMGEIYRGQGLYVDALNYYKQALRMDERVGDSLTLAHDHRDVGMIYKDMGDLDAAMFHYQKAAEHPQLARLWMPMCIAEILYEQGKYHEAIRMLDPILSHRKAHVGEYGRAFLTCGKAHYALGERMEAQSVLEQVAKDGQLQERREAYRYLTYIAIANGGKWAADNAFYYMNHYINETEALLADRQQEALARMTSLYNYSRSDAESRRLQTENRRLSAQNALMLAGFVIASLFAFVCLWFAIRKRTRTDDLEDLVRRLGRQCSDKDRQLERLQQDAEMEEKRRAVATRREKRQARAALAESQAYRMVREHLSAGMALQDEDWMLVQDALAKLFPDFYGELMTWKINVQELHVCMLMKMEFAQSEIALLTARTDEAISSAKRRLCRKVIGTEGSAGEWNRFIESW